MHEELQAMDDIETWTMVPLPSHNGNQWCICEEAEVP